MSAVPAARRFLAVLALISVLGVSPVVWGADADGGLMPCLAVAADGSPVWPTTSFPPAKSLTVVFRLEPGQSAKSLSSRWIALNGSETVVAEHTLDLKQQKSGWLRLVLERPAPPGKYRLDAQLDGKPWKSIDMNVQPAPEQGRAEKPADLIPLTESTTQTYELVATPGSGTRMEVPGVQAGADGRYRSTLVMEYGKKDDVGTPLRGTLNGQPTGELWVKLDDKGLHRVRRKVGDQVIEINPPELLQPLPPKLDDGTEWTAPTEGGGEQKLRLFGPLTLNGPAGPTTGYVIFSEQTQTSGDPPQTGKYTIERHHVPNLGIIREVRVATLSGQLSSRHELTLVPSVPYRIVANPEMKGRLGRVKFAFPPGTKTEQTRVAVFKSGGDAKDKPLANGYGEAGYEILPGKYDVSISGKRVAVEVKSASDTIPSAGVLRVHAGSSTRYRVLDSDQKTELWNGYGEQDIALPLGSYFLEISGSSEPIKIAEGQVVEF